MSAYLFFSQKRPEIPVRPGTSASKVPASFPRAPLFLCAAAGVRAHAHAHAISISISINIAPDKTCLDTCLARNDCCYGARRDVVASATCRL